MIKHNILALDRSGLKNYIFDLQTKVSDEMLKNYNIDDFLDKTDIFDDFEEILSDQEFGILVLTVLNNFKSDIILNDILDIIEKAIENNCNNE